jgi:teichuronic acid biosynthesis glycosyltransferase TuaG
MKYSVIIPTYNHCDDLLKPCVESIFKYTNLADIELIISANGCRDNTSLYLDELRYKFNQLNLANHFQVAWSDEPLGYPKATNAGIKLATTDKIVLLNNDCVLLHQNENDWLNILNSSFEQHEKCGISTVIKEYSSVINAEFAIFCCVMIHRKLFDEIGYLNEEYTPGAGEDTEFSLLAQQKGYIIDQPLKTIPQENANFHVSPFPIYHLAEGTVHDTSLVPDWGVYFTRNTIKLGIKFNNVWKKEKKQNDKKIAVITPVYNDVYRSYKIIDSVKKQTINNVYHYIYDDGSTDKFEIVMNEFEEDNSICYIKNEENKGQSFARNCAIKKAIEDGCDYIAFLDSDDFWNEDHLEKSIFFLNENNDVVYSKPFFISEKNEVMFPVSIYIPEVFIGKHLLYNNYIWISSVVAKKECFINNEFDSNLNSIEDWDMWIRLWKQNFNFIDKKETTIRYLIKENGQASIGRTKYPLLKQKHKTLDKLKLHLACGYDYQDDYINIDLYAPKDAKCDARFDIKKLPYPDNSIDEIKAFHVIEHFHFNEAKDLLSEWNRVLKPGGRIWLETPDFLESCKSFIDGHPSMDIENWRIFMYSHLFSTADPIPGQAHKFLFTEPQLRTHLMWTNFTNMNRLPPTSKYVQPHTEFLFLNMEAFKNV